MSVVRHGGVTLPEDVARCEANHANNKQLWARKRVWSVARAAVRVLALIKHQFQALTYRVNVSNNHLFALCDILTQRLIGLIEYSYHQGIPSFLKAHLQRTMGLNVLGPEQFQDG
jgi:hypothetical protein